MAARQVLWRQGTLIVNHLGVNFLGQLCGLIRGPRIKEHHVFRHFSAANHQGNDAEFDVLTDENNTTERTFTDLVDLSKAMKPVLPRCWQGTIHA